MIGEIVDLKSSERRVVPENKCKGLSFSDISLLPMLILNGICQYEKKYATLKKNICHFFETVTERAFRN